MESVAEPAYDHTVSSMASKEYLAWLFIKQADQQQYGDVKKSFVNDGLKGPEDPRRRRHHPQRMDANRHGASNSGQHGSGKEQGQSGIWYRRGQTTTATTRTKHATDAAQRDIACMTAAILRK